MKRFTETTKWSANPWFRKLSPRLKCLWQFFTDSCDPAGVIEPDWELISFQIGEDVSAADLVHFEGRVTLLENGKYWIVKFIDFQCGHLSPGCKPHQPIFKSIESNKIPYPNLRVLKGYPKDIQREQEEEEDKDKDKEEDKEKETEEGSGEKPSLAKNPQHDPVAIVGLYPRRQSTADAVRAVARHIAGGADPQSIADGTRAIAAIIQRMPSGHLNAYVPSAVAFFEKRRWEDDPQTWLRQTAAGGKTNGAQPEPLSLGGRTGNTIRI